MCLGCHGLRPDGQRTWRCCRHSLYHLSLSPVDTIRITHWKMTGDRHRARENICFIKQQPSHRIHPLIIARTADGKLMRAVLIPSVTRCCGQNQNHTLGIPFTTNSNHFFPGLWAADKAERETSLPVELRTGSSCGHCWSLGSVGKIRTTHSLYCLPQIAIIFSRGCGPPTRQRERLAYRYINLIFSSTL